MKEHNDYILELPNFVSKDFCNNLINKFENTPNPQPGLVSIPGGEVKFLPNIKSTLEHCLSCTPTMEEEFLEYKKILNNAVNLYLHTLKTEYNHDQEIHVFDPIFNYRFTKKLYPLIQKTINGVENKWHFDGGVGVNDLVGVILYLNTLKIEEGGCTEFGHNGRKIRPECGKVLIFPASWTYPHRGCKVIDTNKYIVSCAVLIEKT